MIVTDANILVYRLISAPQTADVILLIGCDAVWTAPPLWRSEVRSALSKHLRAGHLRQHEAEAAMAMGEACLLGGERAVSDRAVFDLVAQSRCSAYDCEYVALAEMLGTFLVTEDRALLRAFPSRCRSILQMI